MSSLISYFLIELCHYERTNLKKYEKKFAFVYLNNNYGNFCSIWSNEASMSLQDNELSKFQHLFQVFYLKFATMKGQTWKIWKKFAFVYLNNNYGNFCPIWSNEASMSLQDKALSKFHLLFYVFDLKFASMKGQTWKICEKLCFCLFK